MKIELDATDLPSSLIDRLEYSWSGAESWKLKREGFLRATFKNGSVYIYEDIPFMIVMNIIGAQDSIGARFNEFIKEGGYKYYQES